MRQRKLFEHGLRSLCDVNAPRLLIPKCHHVYMLFSQNKRYCDVRLFDWLWDRRRRGELGAEFLISIVGNKLVVFLPTLEYVRSHISFF